MNTNIKVGKKVKQRRKQLNISQRELAQMVGFDNRSSISKIENEGRQIPTDKISSFAKALDISIYELLCLDEQVDIHIQVGDDATDHIENIFLSYYEQLNDENKKIAENYLKFLIENQS